MSTSRHFNNIGKEFAQIIKNLLLVHRLIANFHVLPTLCTLMSGYVEFEMNKNYVIFMSIVDKCLT